MCGFITESAPIQTAIKKTLSSNSAFGYSFTSFVKRDQNKAHLILFIFKAEIILKNFYIPVSNLFFTFYTIFKSTPL